MTRHGVRVTAQPGAEPVTLAQAKLQCRVQHSADDALFQGTSDVKGWIAIAREMVEQAANLRLAIQTVEISLARFPCAGDWIELPVWPVNDVTSVTYRRSADAEVTELEEFDTWLSHDPPLVGPPPMSGGWPAVASGYLAPVKLSCVCGNEPGAVPGVAVQAILLTLGFWHGFRGDGRDPTADAAIPFEAGLPASVTRLVRLLRREGYG